MTVFTSVVGEEIQSDVQRAWGSSDAILYALGVGAGRVPGEELEFTTENSEGVPQQVLPTFPVTLVPRLPLERVGDFHLRDVVHAAERLTLHRALAPDGRATASMRVSAVEDKGSGALVTLITKLRDDVTGDALATISRSVFVRGHGGFGGSRSTSGGWAPPDKAPDHELVYEIRPEQALIYRLSGDRNPLHSDPAFARQAGFSRPILHGLCTFGYVGRALLATACGGQVSRFGTMHARFVAPVFPGDTITVLVWSLDDVNFMFQAQRAGDRLLDRGEFATRSRETV